MSDPTPSSGPAPSAPTQTPSGLVRFDTVALDTDDPAGLASFYCDLLGWHVERGDDDWITIRGTAGKGAGAAPRLAFQLAPDHRPPTWPDPEVPQQVHLDLAVDSLPEAGAFAESLGARRVQGPGTEQDFWVYLDPSGHPFCLCLTETGSQGEGVGSSG